MTALTMAPMNNSLPYELDDKNKGFHAPSTTVYSQDARMTKLTHARVTTHARQNASCVRVVMKQNKTRQAHARTHTQAQLSQVQTSTRGHRRAPCTTGTPCSRTFREARGRDSNAFCTRGCVQSTKSVTVQVKWHVNASAISTSSGWIPEPISHTTKKKGK